MINQVTNSKIYNNNWCWLWSLQNFYKAHNQNSFHSYFLSISSQRWMHMSHFIKYSIYTSCSQNCSL